MTERKITKSDCKYYRESDGNCLNFTYVGEYDPCTDGDLEHCYEKFPHFFNKDERMTEKRFSLNKDTEWWFVQDNTIQVNKYGYRDDLTGEDEYR